MAIFCTQCGTKNEDGAAFCENCGAVLRAVARSQKLNPMSDLQASSPVNSDTQALADKPPRKMLVIGLAGAALAVVGAGALYFALSPPAASSSNLTAAAIAGYSPAQLAPYKRELCLSNINYSLSEVNVAEHNRGTLTWLNVLVSAGLYSPAVPISSGGYFPQTMLQYVATPELAKWRQGASLCVAKDIQIADVLDIETPKEESLVRDNDGPKVLTVRAKLLLQATNVAPWLDTPDVIEAIAPRLEHWQYKGAKLQKQVPDLFGLKDSKWTTGPSYKAELEQQAQLSERNSRGKSSNGSPNPKSDTTSLGSIFSGLFSFGGHPLTGTWRMETRGMGLSMGADSFKAAGVDGKISFTSDTMETAGTSVKCRFEVNGDRVKVTPEGQAESLVFVMDGKNSANLDVGLMTLHYTRAD